MIRKSWILTVGFFYLLITLLNKEALSDPNILLHLHPDQVVLNAYLKKSIDPQSFINDFVFVKNNNILYIYNPIEIFLYKHLFLTVNLNINLFYKILFQIYFFIYISIFTILFYKISKKNIKSLIVLLFACSSIYIGFSADVFGFNSIQNIRSAYFILPFLATSLYLLLFEHNNLASINKYSITFFVSNIILNYHPVSQIHFIFISFLYLTSLFISGRIKVNNAILISICIFTPTFPLFYNLIENAAIQKSTQLIGFNLNDFKNVMPAYSVHIPYYAIKNTLRLNILFFVSLIFTISYFFYYYFYYIKNTNHFVNTLFYKVLMFLSSLMFILTFNRGQGFLLLISLLLILLYINVRKHENFSSFSIDRLFLFASSIMVSIVGSMLLNYYNEFRGTSLLNLELIRGVRISYIILLFWFLECISQDKNKLIDLTLLFMLIFTIYQLFINYKNSKYFEKVYYSDFQKLNLSIETSKRKDKKSTFLYIGTNYENSIVEANLLKNMSATNTFYSYDGMNCIYSNKNLIPIFSKRIRDYKKIFDTPGYLDKVASENNISLILISKTSPVKINPEKYSLHSETNYFKIFTK